MQASQTPTRIPLAFAANGSKNAIPTASQIAVTPGAASLNDGFPPLTMTPVAAGGVPPAGQDFNGILNLLSQTIRWQNAGGMFGYNSAFATDSNVGGYPRGALLLRSDQSGAWLNQTDSNTTNPDTGGAGWVPAFMSGVVGQARNLSMYVSAANASATLTADEIVVGTALGGQKYVLNGFNKTINLATTGAGGMDTGTAPVSGFVALYAIYNPTTGASALLAVNATSAVAPNVYGGANMPAGYTASALVSVWPTNASSQFVQGLQNDRNVDIQVAQVLSSSTAQTVTALSIAAAVPRNARSVRGYISGFVNTANSALIVTVFSASVGLGGQSFGAVPPASGAACSGSYALDLQTSQTLYYSASVSAGAFTYSISISSYSF